MTVTKTVPISKHTIKELRMVTNKALADMLTKLGLSAELGRITYIPGKEFRCKLTVRAPRVRPAPGAMPVKGEHWMFGGRSYFITEVDQAKGFVLGKRPSRARSAIAGVATYRIKLAELMASGEKTQ